MTFLIKITYIFIFLAKILIGGEIGPVATVEGLEDSIYQQR